MPLVLCQGVLHDSATFATEDFDAIIPLILQTRKLFTREREPDEDSGDLDLKSNLTPDTMSLPIFVCCKWSSRLRSPRDPGSPTSLHPK